MSKPISRTLCTIGHSTHPIGDFLDLLRKHDITALGDVRSASYSRYNPQFIKETLDASLAEAWIGYVFLGRELGAIDRNPRRY